MRKSSCTENESAPRRVGAGASIAESGKLDASRTWRVYVLRCGDGTLYTGATNDLARRLEHHAAGTGARYTRSRRPVVLVYEERAASKGAALRREWAVKQLKRAEKLALIAAKAARRGRRVHPPR